jgi:hypothetical protein
VDHELEFFADAADLDPDALAIAAADVDGELTIVPSEGLSGIAETALIILIAASRAVVLLERVRRLVRGGTVIDATTEVPVIRTDSSLPHGTIVVQTPDGDIRVLADHPVPETLAAEFPPPRS